MSLITIGRLKDLTGVQVETIRYYEKIGLLPTAHRSAAGYRLYGPQHLRSLSFIRKGRALGFSIDSLRDLLALAAHPENPCDNADLLAGNHLRSIEQKISELESLRDALRSMICCPGKRVAECRIIDALTHRTSPENNDPAKNEEN
jgi:MerR family transcriptional regulator, mercuric resistance operon regulatory protein